jgi:SAM-dependent methyltransferase
MKDASAFNILFDGSHPVFVDHGSFRDGYSGHWPGYSQFGDHFMSPLLIEATAGLTPTAAGFGVDGIPLNTARALSTGTGRFRRASVSWIWRRAVAERLSGQVDQTTGERLADTALPKPTVQAILDRAMKRIEPLESSAPSYWRDYESKACPYDGAQSAKKRHLVSQWASEVEGRGLALDVGCNVGTFAEVLAENFERVIAIDNDSVAIDILYQRASSEPWGSRVTPAVVDLAQPTPAIGWMNRERASFLDRLGVVDVSIWLAVLHHLILTSGIPLAEVLNLIANTSRHAIIEHIAPEDRSVASMTAGRRWARVPGFAEFASRLDDRGFVTMQSEKTSPTRTLVLVRCPT